MQLFPGGCSVIKKWDALKYINGSHKEQVSAFLTADERYTIRQLLDREPSEFELNMFAAMWSEHISYKSSSTWIEQLFSAGDHVMIPAGKENAGIIELDDELACVIKMESHNHPLAVNSGEAAVGVGNIFRDIISMGARPVAHLNVLRFGNLREEHVRTAVKDVLQALGVYADGFGTPVVGGEILFHDSYSQNPMLNLMAVGVVKKDRIVTSAFRKKGDIVLLVGKKTSGSGVHGAGFASTPFSGTAQYLVPETQQANPGEGKVLCECLLEMTEEGLIASMQDVGAGGVLCAASEMAFRGSMGVELQVDRIPVMRDDLDAIEILLSQSQEQMLLSVTKRNVDRLKALAGKRGVSVAEIGVVTGDGKITVTEEDEVYCTLPVSSLVRGGGAPVYLRNRKDPGRKVIRVTADEVPYPGDLTEVARQIITHPNVASRKFIYEQFGPRGGLSGTGLFFPSDAGVLNIPGCDRMVALSVDGNSRYVRRQPRTGTMIAVAESARNIVCSGGRPVALANGLNFGDPADPHVYHDFTESVKGIREISEKMGIPVIAGNVSFNNVTRDLNGPVSVQPTPVIGMVGVIDRREELTPVSFRSKGDMIYLVGRSDNDLSGSEYLSAIHLVEDTAAPVFDPDHELRLHAVVRELITNRLVESAHDVSMGGLFVALVESCIPESLGFDITSPAEVRTDAFLFGESQGRIVVSVSPANETAFLDFMMDKAFPFSALGHVTKQELRIDDSSYGFIAEYTREFENALPNLLER